MDRVSDLLELPLPEELKKETRNELDDRMPLSLLIADIDEVTLAEPSTDVSASYVELCVSPPMMNTLSYLPRQPQPGEVVLLQIGPNTVRQVVAQRDDDVLTPRTAQRVLARSSEGHAQRASDLGTAQVL